MNACALCGFILGDSPTDAPAPACRSLRRCPNCGYESTVAAEDKSVRRAVPLSQWPEKAEARVSHLHASDPQIHRRLAAMGLLPSAHVVVERRAPSFVLRIGSSRFAADEELVRAVYVQGLA